MRKLIYIVPILLLIVGIFLWSNRNKEKVFDKKVTFSKKDSRPYGTKVLYSFMPLLFPKAEVSINKKSPFQWFSYESAKSGKQLFFALTKQFNPEKEELKYLYDFVKLGNTVFVTTADMNEVATNFLKVKVNNNEGFSFNMGYIDSVNVHLKTPAFLNDTTYLNYGFSTNNYFTKIDTPTTLVLGNSHTANPNFICFNIGKGKILIHTDPFLFSNYFILKDNNINYLQKCFSLANNSVDTIIWDEYYTAKSNVETKKKSSLNILFSYDAFRWAFLLIAALAIIYTIIHFKRKTRYIEVKEPLKNDTIEFAKTIGRLYFEKKDHANLAYKMTTYFLEHVRSKYLINTSNLDETFIRVLSGKSGYSEVETYKLIQSVVNIRVSHSMSQEKLNFYYNQFQQFYKTTN